MSKVNAVLAAALAGAVLVSAAPAFAAQCNPKGGFTSFITDFKKEAASKGISAKGLAALDGLTVDDKVLAADRNQKVFKQSFEEFSGRMISKDRLSKGGKLMQQARRHAQAHREAIRRAGRGRGRNLGPRDRLRRQPGQDVGRALGGNARL